MVKCSAPLCGNATYKKTDDITFHRFPKDENIKLAWLTNMKRQDWQPTSSSVLCSKHFEPYFIDKSGFRTVLVSVAIPTIFDHFVQNIPTLSRDHALPYAHSVQPSTSTTTASPQHPEPPPRSQTEDLESQGCDHDKVKKSTEHITKHQTIGTEYKCNECGGDIVGCVYVCVQCARCAVCAACEARGAHRHHYALRVPHNKHTHEVTEILERIRQIIIIVKQQHQEVIKDENDSFTREVATEGDPLEGAELFKTEPQDPSKVDSESHTDITVGEATIEEDAQTAELDKRSHCRKRRASSPDTLPVKLPDMQIKISLDRVSEVISKRNSINATRHSPDSVPSFSKRSVNTTGTHEVPTLSLSKADAPMTFHQASGFMMPNIMYITESGDSNIKPDLHTFASSSQAQVVTYDPSQPVEELVIKTETPE